MQKKPMAIVLIACLLLLSVVSLAPSVGKVFVAVAVVADCSDTGDNGWFGVAAAVTGATYGGLAAAAGVTSAVASGGISLVIGL